MSTTDAELGNPSAQREDRATAQRDDRAPALREDQEVPLPLRRMAAWGWRLIVVAAAAWVVMKALAPVTSVVIPVILAILLTALLNPLVNLLTRRTPLNRGLSSALALIGFILAVLGMFYFAGTQLMKSFDDIRSKSIAGFRQLTQWAARTFGLDDNAIDEATTQLLDRLRDNAGQLISGAMSGLSTASTIVSGIFICLFTLLFLLLGGQKIWRWLVSTLPRGARIPTHEAGRRGWRALGYYVRTQVLVAAVDAFGIAIGLALLGLPQYAVPVWLIVFLFSFIPIIGAILSGAVACLLVLVMEGFWPAVIMLVIVLVVQQVEGNVLNPLLMGRAVELHPLAIFLGVAFGGTLYGMVGALLSIPVLSFLNAFIGYLANRDPAPTLAPDVEGWRAFGMTADAGAASLEQPSTPDASPPRGAPDPAEVVAAPAEQQD